MSEKWPILGDLEDEQKRQLQNLTPEDVQQLQIGEVFTDDHAMCVSFTIKGIETGAWWLTPEAAAAFHYLDSPKAREVVCELIKEGLDFEE